MDNEIAWKILNRYFKDDPCFLARHHLDSYNDFFENGLYRIFKEKNPIHFYKKKDTITIDRDTKIIKEQMLVGNAVTLDELKELIPNKTKEEYDLLWESSRDGRKKTLRFDDYKYQIKLYMGGKSGKRIYYGKPIIADDNGNRYMYPNEARLKNFTYAISIHYDVEVEIKLYLPLDDGSGKYKEDIHYLTLNKIYLGKFPIMLKSNLCILNNVAKRVANNM